MGFRGGGGTDTLWVDDGGTFSPKLDPTDFIVNPSQDHDETIGRDLNIETGNDVNIEAAQDVNMNAGRDFGVISDRLLGLTAGTVLTIDGPGQVLINSNGDIQETSATGSIALTVADPTRTQRVVAQSTKDVDLIADRNVHVKVAQAGGIGNLILAGLPTADPGVSGALWNSAGTLKVSP